MAHASLSADHKALIIAPAWVGDMVMAHGLVQRLTERHAEIHIAAPPATLPLAARMREVAHSIELPLQHGALQWGARRQIGRQLASGGYTSAYVLPNSWKSALLPWFAGIPRRVGWLGEGRYGLLNQTRRLPKDDLPLMLERFLALGDPDWALPAKPYPRPELQVDENNQQQLQARFQLPHERLVVLCPGAEFGPAKKWPAEHYAGLAQALLAEGFAVCVLGSAGDRADGDQIAALAPQVINLAGQTSLLDAVDILGLAHTVVSNDSGLMHVAGALGRPVVAIFGSTSPGFTPPLGEQAQVVEQVLDCRPCFQRACPLGHTNCLQQLQPQQVLARLAL